MRRLAFSCLVGIVTSTLAMGLIFGMLAYFGIGPIGQFINVTIPQIISGQSFDDKSFELMHQGLVFSWLVILPLSSLIGSLVGVSISPAQRPWVGLAAAMPMVIMALLGKSDGVLRVLSALSCLAIGVVVGYIGEFLWIKRATT
jgi:hypothetical protein